VRVYNKGLLGACLVPGGVLLLLAVATLQGGVVPIPAQAVDFYYYTVFVAGFLLAWRFHSSRIMFVLLTLLLGHHAIEFFSTGGRLVTGPGHIAFETVALLVPVNYIVFAVAKERGFSVPAMASRLGLLFFEAVLVAVICRPGESQGPWFVRAAVFDTLALASMRIPQPALLAFMVAAGVLVVRFLLRRAPVEHGLVWSLAAAFAGFCTGALGRVGSAYFATAGLILVASLVENSYFLAYHDELTGLPARRAFNDALLSLESFFAIAMVDIDHFKNVNDKYGHDTGDQVLSMVASRLGHISSGGRAYRVGGEEFAILFPGKMMKDVLPELERLRVVVSESSFRVRGVPERRSSPRGPDRRQERTGRSKPRLAKPTPMSAEQLSVTVSIGVAEPGSGISGFEAVIQAADKALYRAKRGGRNRIETAKPSNLRLVRRAASS